MDLWQLHIFTKVVEMGSFSKAAQAVNLSQPTVSSHIKDLEDHLNCRLIDRLGRKASSTKGGELLYSFATRLLALRDEAESAMSSFLGKPTGVLAIAGSNIPGCYVLPRVIGAFSKHYPDVSISLKIGDTRSVAEDVLSGTVEMGLVGALSPNKQLTQDILMEDHLTLIVPASHPLANQEEVSIQSLGREPFIIREQGSGTRKFFEKVLADAGMGLENLNIAAQLGSTEAVREAIKAGLGVSIFSTRAVMGDLRCGTLKSIEISDLDFRRFFYIVRHRQRTASPLCQYFCDFLTANVTQLISDIT
ncbi:MAG: LysR family transcriptional regulator [Desulfatibacillum sp.]|nr:LysR family transcriptional regulator [Desulfatibacillum sp.]